MRLNDIEMLTASGRATAQQVRHVLDEIYKELESSAATRLLTAIRRLPYADCSVCESRLQSTYGWPKPFEEVQRLMKSAALGGEERFEDFRLAVNVLKHGKGPSHTRLLARANRLPFKVQSLFGELHEKEPFARIRPHFGFSGIFGALL
jgi:hypothetical protein